MLISIERFIASSQAPAINYSSRSTLSSAIGLVYDTTRKNAFTMSETKNLSFAVLYEFLLELITNFFVFFRLYRRKFTPPHPLDGQVIVITGATRSMGKDAAVICASLGARIIIPCRDTSLGHSVAKVITDAGHLAPLVVEMDLCSLDSIANAVRIIKKITPKVDAIINNAGALIPSRQLTSDSIESIIQTNYVGQFLFTKALLSHLSKSPDPRVIFVSSIGHHSAAQRELDLQDLFNQTKFDMWVTYAQSKLLSLMFCRSLTKMRQNIRFYSVDPGVAVSDIARDFPNWAQFLNAIKVVRPFLRASHQAARAIIGPLFLPKSSYNPDCFYYGDSQPKKCAKVVFDDNLCQDVYQMTQELVANHLLVS